MTDISDVTHGFTKVGKGIIAKKITIQQDLIATGHSNKDEPTKTFNIKLQNNSGGTADTFMTMTNTGSTKSTEITGNLNITGNLTVADAAVGGGSDIIDQSDENDTVKNAIANALTGVTYTNSAFSDNYSIVNSIGDNLIRLITIANNDNMKFIFYSSGVACLLNTYNAPVISGDLTYTVGGSDITTISGATFTADKTVTWSLSGGTDQSDFNINGSGELSFSSAKNYIQDGTNTYQVTIKALDKNSNDTNSNVTLFSEKNISVTINDTINPTISHSSPYSILENVSTVATLTADETVTWSIESGLNGSLFEISSGGVLSFLSAPDFENPEGGTNSDSNEYQVTVEALDAAGNSSTATITVNVTDHSSPTITSSSSFSHAENTTEVATLAANVTSTWSIVGGSNQSDFSITSGGVLSFSSAPSFNSSGSNAYEVTVRATASNEFSDQTITVTVTDATAPLITGPSGSAGDSTSSVSIIQNTTAVHTFTATDDSTVTFSKNGGANESEFSITSAGVLTFNTAPSFDSVTSSNNEYVVVVRATDSANNTSDQTVTVNVIAQTLINWNIETFNNNSFSTGLWDNLIISSSSTGYSNIWSSISSPTQWSIKQGATLSNDTGPNSGDQGSGYYIYTEATGSDNNVSNSLKTFRLQSDTFKFAVNGSINYSKFTFKYHMFGEDLDDGGLLCVKILKVNSSDEAQEISPQCVFRREGEQHTSSSSNNWTQAVIEFNNNMQMYDGDGSSADAVDFSVNNNDFFTWVNGSRVKLIIEAKTGYGFMSDIGIDTLKLEYVEEIL